MNQSMGIQIGPKIKIGGDIAHSIDQLASGAGSVVNSAMQNTIKSVENVVKTTILVTRAAVGDVKWGSVLDSLSETFKSINTMAIVLNPTRIWTNLASENVLTKKAFSELDKFSGGMITTNANVSDLVYRAARGEAISKEELIRDAVFGIQVAGIIVGGPVAQGAFVGNLIGKQVCDKQTANKDSCLALFTVLGAAAGSGIESALSRLAQDKAVGEATKQVINVCRTSGAGSAECQAIGEIAAKYYQAAPGTEWLPFLASEVTQRGIDQSVLNMFPVESPEAQAINYRIKYEKIPAKAGAGTIAALVGGAVILFSQLA